MGEMDGLDRLVDGWMNGGLKMVGWMDGWIVCFTRQCFAKYSTVPIEK